MSRIIGTCVCLVPNENRSDPGKVSVADQLVPPGRCNDVSHGRRSSRQSHGFRGRLRQTTPAQRTHPDAQDQFRHKAIRLNRTGRETETWRMTRRKTQDVWNAIRRRLAVCRPKRPNRHTRRENSILEGLRQSLVVGTQSVCSAIHSPPAPLSIRHLHFFSGVGAS